MNPDDPLSPMIAGNFSSITKEVGVEVPSHAQRILRKLSEMRNNTNLCDTELCCQGDSYLVHRSVLSGGSEYFANYFDRWVSNPPQKQVLLKSVESSALSVILDFLYSGVLNITTDNMFDIFGAADTLQVEEARYVCITKLHVHLNQDSCVETLNFAQLYSLHALSEAAITLICTEPLVYTGRRELTTESWIEIQKWLEENRMVINPYTSCSNILQIKPGCEAQLRRLLDGFIDNKTNELLNMKILPTAFSILNAARANIETTNPGNVTQIETRGEVTSALTETSTQRDHFPASWQAGSSESGVPNQHSQSIETPQAAKTSEKTKLSRSTETSQPNEPSNQREPSQNPESPPFSVSKLTLPSRPSTSDNPSTGSEATRVIPSALTTTSSLANVPETNKLFQNILTQLTSDDQTERNTPDETLDSSSRHIISGSSSSTTAPRSDDHSLDTDTRLTATGAYPNKTRLWSMACNHLEIFDDGMNRISKKRRVDQHVNHNTIQHTINTTDADPKWITKIMLLGGCNSMMSTVRTIFRHIRPFSVVTGVTVVADNLALNIRPEFKADDEWDECGRLSQLCYGCASTTVGTKAYVFGGKGHNSQYLATFQEFDMVDSTSKLLPSAPHPKENAVAVRIGSDVYIIGGRNNTVQHGQYLVDKYSVKSGKWSSVAPCFKIGYLGAAAACNGLLYTFCGQRPHGKATDTVMCYEPHSNSWSPQPNAPTTMNECKATTHHRKIFILTTEHKNFILYQFQPDQKLWSKVNKCEPYLSGPQSFFIMNSAIVSNEGYLYVLLFMCEDVVRVIRVQKFNISSGEWQIVSTKPVPVQNSGVVMMSFCKPGVRS